MRILLKTVLMLLCLPSVASASVDPAVRQYLERFPAQTFAQEQALCAALLEAGPDAIQGLAHRLVAEGGDAAVRTALQSLAMDVGRAGREPQRVVFVRAIEQSLRSAEHKETQAFLIELLQWAGGDESVEVLSGYLADRRLCDPAARALTTIGTPTAADALLAALSQSQAAESKAVVLALGRLRAEQAVEVIARFAENEDMPLRHSAHWALANIGYASAAEVIAADVAGATGVAKASAGSNYLLLARRLAEKGHVERAAAMCRQLLADSAEGVPIPLRAGALETLVTAAGHQAMDDILAAAVSNNESLQAAAVNLADRIEGPQATQRWIALLNDAEAPLAERIATMLGHRGHRAALPAIIGLLDHSDISVATAAMNAAVQLDQAAAITAILEMLVHTDSAERIAAGVDILMRLPNDNAPQAAARSLRSLPSASRIAMMDGLAGRRATGSSRYLLTQVADSDTAVRRAAIRALSFCAAHDDLTTLLTLMTQAEDPTEQAGIQRAVVAAARQNPDSRRRADEILERLVQAEGSDKILLIRTVGQVGGGSEALQVVLGWVTHDDAQIKDAAIRALADWPDVAAADGLLDVIKTESLRYQVLALRSALRLMQDSTWPNDRKVQWAAEALDTVERNQEKQFILSFLGPIKTFHALALAAQYLEADDESLKTAAAVAIVNIALPDSDHQGLRGIYAAKILTSAIDALPDNEVRRRVEAYHATLPSLDDFSRLFNGNDLAGWVNTDGWAVEDGLLQVVGRGSDIYTEREYDNFEIYFEFNLSESGNSGLFFRRGGLEIQLLDDVADKHADLQEWQYCGSLYGVVAARKGASRPSGRWQTMVMRLDGQDLLVILNDKPIIETNLEDHRKQADTHPGLDPGPGRLGFQNYGGSGIRFRNIRLRTLE